MYMKLKDKAFAHIDRLTQLASLDLSGSKITDETVKKLSNLALKNLILDKCYGLGSQSTIEISKISTLLELDLGNCKNIPEESFGELSKLSNLKRINLGGTRITEESFKEIFELNLSLSRVNLHNCKNLSKEIINFYESYKR